ATPDSHPDCRALLIRIVAPHCGLSWEAQEIVRFIDIAVPSAERGGIFNHANGASLIEELEDALDKVYGGPFRSWLLFLMKENPRASVRRLIDEFVSKVGPRSNLEKRAARKFGLLYAAGALAVEANILTWPTARPLNVMRRLFARWRSHNPRPDRTDPLVEFQRLLGAKGCIIKAKSNEVVVPDASRLIGVEAPYKGKPVLGLLKGGLERSLGPEHASAVLSWLKRTHLVFGGPGGLQGTQLPIVLVIDGKRKRPRLLLVDPAALRSNLATVAHNLRDTRDP
ncbi:hypothetical protein ACWGTO_30570, partial [Mesorhizobium sp. PL10]